MNEDDVPQVKLQCQMEATYSATRRLPDVAQPVVPASGTTRLTVSMDLYRDDTFTDLVKSQVNCRGDSLVRYPTLITS